MYLSPSVKCTVYNPGCHCYFLACFEELQQFHAERCCTQDILQTLVKWAPEVTVASPRRCVRPEKRACLVRSLTGTHFMLSLQGALHVFSAVCISGGGQA